MYESLVEGPDGRFGKYRHVERQDCATVDKTAEGKYYVWFEPVSQLHTKLGQVRAEYFVRGNRLTFPKKWGKRKAALKLTGDIMAEQQLIINRAQAYVDGLSILHAEIAEWPDDELEQLENHWLHLPKIKKNNETI